MPPPVRRKLLASTWIVLALAFVLTGTALAGNGGIAPPAPHSPNAGGIRDAYWLVLAITGAIFVLVETALVVFVIRYRSAGRPREVEGPQIRGHGRLELIWTAVPILILAGIASFVFYKLNGIDTAPATAAGDHLEVRVEGRQFYWRFVYPNGAVAVNELRAPAGRVVDLDITAPANDVAHSWWIPSLGGKLDAIPGKVNHTWFRADQVGVYQGQCAEFCGAQHALMIARVRVVPPAEFDVWLSQQVITGAGLGKQTFEGACGPCHGVNGQGLIGPPLQGNGTLANPKLLFQLLQNGKRAMPPVGRGWDQRQLTALSAYVKKRFSSGG